MNTIVTHGIVLRRTNYGEADRIVQFITADKGKISLIAKGVRRLKSKLAGGVELFSISSLSYIQGRSDLGTLVSARLEVHFGEIIKDINRVQLGYELIKLIDKNTEDEPEPEYFQLLSKALESLNDTHIEGQLIQQWCVARILQLAGHSPNLQTVASGKPLPVAAKYSFDGGTMSFAPSASGRFLANDVKFLRLLFAAASPRVVMKVNDVSKQLKHVAPLVNLWQQQYIR